MSDGASAGQRVPLSGRHLGAATLIVSSGVLLARVLGFLREMIFAYVLGASRQSDVYFLAFVIPDFINYLLAGGYLSITFIPLVSKYLARNDEAGAWAAFWAIALPITALITVAVAAAWLFAPWLMPLLGPGLSAAQRADALRLTRIVLPAQVFFVVGSLFVAIQYARDRFVVPTLAGLIYNLGIIAGGLILGGALGLAADGFAWGVLGGALLGNLLIQIWGARGAGLRWVGRQPLAHPALRADLWLALPLMLGQSIVVLDEQLTRSLGSIVGEGALSWLNYARRLMLVPVGVLAQAAGVATFPALARFAADDRLAELRAAVAKATRYVVFASVVAAGWLVAVSEPVVRLVYERGRFDAAATVATAQAFGIYALAIPIWAAQQLLARGFYARAQMWPPVLLGTVATALSLPLYWFAAARGGHLGLAAASVVILLAYTLGLGVAWRRRVGPEALAGLGASLGRVVLSSIPASIAARVVVERLDGALLGLGAGRDLLALAGASVTYGAILLPVLVLAGARELNELGQPLLVRLRHRFGR